MALVVALATAWVGCSSSTSPEPEARPTESVGSGSSEPAPLEVPSSGEELADAAAVSVCEQVEAGGVDRAGFEELVVAAAAGEVDEGELRRAVEERCGEAIP